MREKTRRDVDQEIADAVEAVAAGQFNAICYSCGAG